MMHPYNRSGLLIGVVDKQRRALPQGRGCLKGGSPVGARPVPRRFEFVVRPLMRTLYCTGAGALSDADLSLNVINTDLFLIYCL